MIPEYSVAAGVLPPGEVQYPLVAIAVIISGHVIGLPVSVILSSMEKFPALNLATGQAIQLEKKPPISPLGNTRLTLMPDGRTLLLSTGRGVVVWALRGGHEPRTVAGAGEEVVGFSDGKTVLTNNGSLQRWDLTTGEPLWPLVTDIFGNIRLFPTDTDGQDALLIPPSVSHGAGNAFGLDKSGGQIYMTQRDGDLVQVNDNGIRQLAWELLGVQIYDRELYSFQSALFANSTQSDNIRNWCPGSQSVLAYSWLI